MLKFMTRNPDIRPNPGHLATLGVCVRYQVCISSGEREKGEHFKYINEKRKWNRKCVELKI